VVYDPSFTGVIVFILVGIMAFATRTSFGTFAIMTPIALQIVVISDVNIYLAVGAAISGGIMGDHCSPIQTPLSCCLWLCVGSHTSC